MADRKRDAIGLSDLNEYLEREESDFAFELETLRLLTSRGLECEHGGVYDDPVTKKTRQFDIRATKTGKQEKAPVSFVHLAVECKNVRPHSPVLVSRVARTRQESYHSVAWLSDPSTSTRDPLAGLSMFRGRAKVHTVWSPDSLYKEGEPVGKAYAQIGRQKAGGDFTDDDSRFFDRISQALSSVAGVIRSMYYDGQDERFHLTLVTAFPIVVVPSGRLWAVNYADDGSQAGDPTQVDRCPVYVDKRYLMGGDTNQVAFFVSHVEVLTPTGLDRFIADYLGSAAEMEKLFPVEAMLRRR